MKSANISSTKRQSLAKAALAVSSCAVLGLVVAAQARTQPESRQVELPPDLFSSEIPKELNPEYGGAPDASLEQAAIFAWRKMIALNWPAEPGRREVAAKVPFGAAADARVWETFRGRVEVYPGTGRPFATPGGDYGYEAPPRYVYDPATVGSYEGVAPGETPSCGNGASGPVPWHNLDEPNHNLVRSALSPADRYPGQQILLESKVNRAAYVYVASRGWYGDRSIRSVRRRTGEYVRTEMRSPPAPAKLDDPNDTSFVSFPNGAMELKAAWRRLGRYDDPKTFQTSRVRYYRQRDGKPCHIDSEADDRWGLVAMHVTLKTPSAPYYIWATFEHATTLVADQLGPDGRPLTIERPDGSVTAAGRAASTVYTPEIRVAQATLEEDQEIFPASTESAVPSHRLYFHQPQLYDIPEVKHVAINRRLNPIPDVVVEVNRAVQEAIQREAPNSPLRHYRLVSVQWVPMTKAPGAYYSGPGSPGVYYASNVIIEGPPVHQAFSGQFTHGFSKAGDYLHRVFTVLNPRPNPGAPVFLNTFHGGKGFLAGGCMGCHGSRQAYGTDFSFLFERQRIREPEVRPEP